MNFTVDSSSPVPRTPLLAIPRINTEVRLVRCGTRQRRFESADGGDAALAGVE
jgi:hypothetical protein